MPLIIKDTFQAAFKTEGTSRTYGQEVVEIGESTADAELLFPENAQLQSSEIQIEVPVDEDGTITEEIRQDAIKDTVNSGNKGLTLQDTEADSDLNFAINNLTDTYSLSDDEPTLSSPTPSGNTTAVFPGSTIMTRPHIVKAITEGLKVDLSIAIASAESDMLEFNNLKRIDPESKFVYNFYTNYEDDLQKMENPELDPLLSERFKEYKLPMYVDINWDIANVVNQKRSVANDPNLPEDNQEFRDGVFSYPGRVGNVTREGRELDLVDVKHPDVSFDATANKDRYVNSITVTIDPESRERNVLLDRLSIPDGTQDDE